LALTINPFSHKTRNAIQRERVSRWSSNFKLTNSELNGISDSKDAKFKFGQIRAGSSLWRQSLMY
jgi:hypothetical protein